MKRKRLFISMLFALLAFPAYSVEYVTGNICKKDSVVSAADYAMIYLPEYKVGAIADEQGNYKIQLPAGAKEKGFRMEFSMIGYETKWQDVRWAKAANGTANGTTGKDATMKLDTVTLGFEPIMLAASYVTPDGMDPAKYILSQVWKTADKNKKKVANYKAEVQFDVTTHNLPIIAQIIPGFTLGIVKMGAAFMGFGPFVDYSLKTQDLFAQVTLERTVTNGRAKDNNIQMVKCSDGLPKSVKTNIMTGFKKINLYGMLYGNDNAWGRKFSRRSDFELIGSYLYDDKIVDVLHWEDPNSDATATLHIVEENWGILKVQVGRGEEAVLCQARDIGNGIYMPVSFIMKPSLTRIKHSDIPKFIERVKTEKGLNKTIRKRAIKVLEQHHEDGKDFNPYIIGCYNVHYLPLK